MGFSSGSASDFTLGDRLSLSVSERAYEVIRCFALAQCEVTERPDQV